MNTTIERLQAWYASQCVDRWEHAYGVTISTVDNPGWRVEIDLVGTSLQTKPFETWQDDYDGEMNWIRCRLEEGKFIADCGPLRLNDALECFLVWADAAN